MYSRLKNVQVIISLLKQNNISDIVLSPGTRDEPLVHSVEQDNFFNCFSCVDERSAAYLAIGLSKQSGRPACVTCTSSTASSNYTSAIKQAAREGVPLIVLTADRNNQLLRQGEDQLIEQDGMYGNLARKSANLPIVKSSSDLGYCIREVNEALLSTNLNGKHPCQINYQVQEIDLCREKTLPTFRHVVRHDAVDELDWDAVLHRLNQFRRILIVAGQGYYSSAQDLANELDLFDSHFNVTISEEITSNIHCASSVKTSLITEAMTDSEFEEYKPDLVITIGGHFFSFLKYKLRNMGARIEHWRISESGSYLDNFGALTEIFHCSALEFFRSINAVSGDIHHVNEYRVKWQNRVDEVVFPDLKFSNFSVIKEFADVIPVNSLIHMSILNSFRLFNYTCSKNVRAFCNLGADGIDGAVSTFMGQARDESTPAFLIVGDLSFIYDMNSAILPHAKNIRILLINNQAGSEFHTNFGKEKIPTLDDFVAAGHESTAQQMVKMTDFRYLEASNSEELKAQLGHFTSQDEEGPILLEVHTNADLDSEILKKFYSMNERLNVKEKSYRLLKNAAKQTLKTLHLR